MNAAQAFSWQANLLETGLVKGPRQRLPKATVPAVLIGVLVVCSLGYSHLTLKNLSESKKRAEWAELHLADLGARLNTERKTDAKAQQQQAENLEAEVAGRHAILKSLNEALARDHHGWSAQAVLHTLSEQHNDELWLTRIRIDRLRHEISLEGVAANAQAISKYINRLGSGDSALSRMAVSNVESEGNGADIAAGSPASPVNTLKFKLNSKGVAP